MTERPINLHAHEVRAALAGSLGLIVRPVKPQPFNDDKVYIGLFAPMGISRDGTQYAKEEVYGAWSEDGEWSQKSPFGQPGDKLWGRETFRFDFDIRIESDKLTRSTWQLAYGADEPELRKVNWRPSTHMPRWASRITFETTSIAVKQVRDITEAEAMACGVERIEISPREIDGIAVHPMTGTYVDAFHDWYQKQYGDAHWAWFASVKGAE